METFRPTRERERLSHDEQSVSTNDEENRLISSILLTDEERNQQAERGNSPHPPSSHSFLPPPSYHSYLQPSSSIVANIPTTSAAETNSQRVNNNTQLKTEVKTVYKTQRFQRPLPQENEEANHGRHPVENYDYSGSSLGLYGLQDTVVRHPASETISYNSFMPILSHEVTDGPNSHSHSEQISHIS